MSLVTFHGLTVVVSYATGKVHVAAHCRWGQTPRSSSRVLERELVVAMPKRYVGAIVAVLLREVHAPEEALKADSAAMRMADTVLPFVKNEFTDNFTLIATL